MELGINTKVEPGGVSEPTGAGPRNTERHRDVAASLEHVEVAFTMPGRGGTETRQALAGVSIVVREGELLVLVGRSGCGKTTALNVLAGLVSATRGTATVLGTSPKRARSQVGYMFARDCLLPWRAARRNVEFGLELRRPQLRKAERRTVAQRYLDELGVGASANLYPWQLSQGMRQRVALARTWAIEPEVLLLDEPFAALDAQTRMSVQAGFLDVWAAHRRTVVFVTHDLSEAILLGDRVVVMADGAVVDEAEIDLPRPRDADMIVDEPKYRDLHRRLVASLRGQT